MVVICHDEELHLYLVAVEQDEALRGSFHEINAGFACAILVERGLCVVEKGARRMESNTFYVRVNVVGCGSSVIGIEKKKVREKSEP